MSSRDEKTGSMIFSEEETRYLRALLRWDPSHADYLVKRKPVPERPLAGEFRVLILGAKGCGKTALLTRFCKGVFTGEGQPPTPDYERECQRKIDIKDQLYRIDALELAPSQLPDEQLLRHAIAITEGAVLMYDVRSRDSFVLIQDLYKRIQEALVVDKRQHYGLILVGNKADGDGEDNQEEDKHREITEGEGYEFACNLGGGATRCPFRETSARTGENVKDIFVLLGTELLGMRRLTQQRRERAEDLARMAGMEEYDGKDLHGSSKKTKWRVWSRPWFRRASGDVPEKACIT